MKEQEAMGGMGVCFIAYLKSFSSHMFVWALRWKTEQEEPPQKKQDKLKHHTYFSTSVFYTFIILFQNPYRNQDFLNLFKLEIQLSQLCTFERLCYTYKILFHCKLTVGLIVPVLYHNWFQTILFGENCCTAACVQKTFNI